jgi:hypothetical protein
MTVKARRGRIFGAELKDVLRGVAGFRNRFSVLTVHGRRPRPEPGFPAFHRREPGRRDASTTSPIPSGPRDSGSLDLQLVLAAPHRLSDSRVKGDYQFTRNQLPAQPNHCRPFTEAAGRVGFTESQLTVQQRRCAVSSAMR